MGGRARILGSFARAEKLRRGQKKRKVLQGRRERLHRGKERPCREGERSFTGGKNELAEKLHRGPNTLFPSLLVLEKVLLSLT